MNRTVAWGTLGVALLLSLPSLSGCATQPVSGTKESVAAQSTFVDPKLPSAPVVEQTLHDSVDGTTVTPLAIVTDFPTAEVPTPGLRAVLVQVRLEAGDEFSGWVRPSVVSITRHDANLDYVILGMGNPDNLTPAMAAAGYTPLQIVPSGSSSTAWIGAWMQDDVSEFDLVYDRPAGTIVGGARNGERVEGSRAIAALVVGAGVSDAGA